MGKKAFKKRYLEKFTRYPKQTYDNPQPTTNLIIVIPCLNEPEILKTLDSVWSCNRPDKPVEVLVTINHSREAPDEIKAFNEATYQSVLAWSKQWSDDYFKVIPLWYGDIKPKIAGVGTARKLGMDEAVYRFYEIDQPGGIIACLDADCSVTTNYLEALSDHFKENPDTSGCAIYFEHPLEGPERPELYQAIVDFELYLRYYKNALAWAGFPYAFHTIGSVMAVPCDIYQKVGGMNKQIAGEDFYFLEKVIYQGNFTELNAACVYPSPRKSLRVPFGTGQAITDFIENQQSTIQVFNPDAYRDFRNFLEKVPQLYHYSGKWESTFQQFPASIQDFLAHYDYAYYIAESLQHASNENIFLKRFYHWFNAFMALKYLHFARDHYYDNIPIKKAIKWLFEALGLTYTGKDKKQLLAEARQWDKAGGLKPCRIFKF